MQLSCNKNVFVLLGTLLLLGASRCASGQESPYFVTYDHHLEEPGNLDVEASTTTDIPRAGQVYYFAPYTEFEYGVTANWTSELYLESDATWGDSTIFTGWRLENRYRPLKRQHLINPVLYLEYENITEASKILKEVEGTAPDLTSPNSVLQAMKDHELEGKLILSSDTHDWNVSGNFIVAKNFSQTEGVEFGYALGFYRPLATLASGSNCRFCKENFSAGMEIYGGLGSTLEGFGFHDTAHYAAPIVSWLVSDNTTLRFSVGAGLTHDTNPVLIRFGYSYEVQGIRGRIARMFGSKE